MITYTNIRILNRHVNWFELQNYKGIDFFSHFPESAVCACWYICMCVHVCVHYRALCQMSLSTLHFERRSLTEPETCQFSYPGLLGNPQDPPCLLILNAKLRVLATEVGYSVGSGSLNGAPFACMASALLMVPLLQYLNLYSCCTVLWLCPFYFLLFLKYLYLHVTTQATQNP